MPRKTTIEGLAGMVKRGFDGVDRRFDKVDERLDRIEKLKMRQGKREK